MPCQEHSDGGLQVVELPPKSVRCPQNQTNTNTILQYT